MPIPDGQHVLIDVLVCGDPEALRPLRLVDPYVQSAAPSYEVGTGEAPEPVTEGCDPATIIVVPGARNVVPLLQHSLALHQDRIGRVMAERTGLSGRRKYR